MKKYIALAFALPLLVATLTPASAAGTCPYANRTPVQQQSSTPSPNQRSVSPYLQNFGSQSMRSRIPASVLQRLQSSQSRLSTPQIPADWTQYGQAPTAPSQPASSAPSAPSTPINVSQAAQQVLDLVNQARTKANLPPLTWNNQLASAAQGHAEDMQKRNFFDHVNPDGLSPTNRIQAAGYRGSTYGENIARGQTSPEQVMNDWMNSPGHRENILRPSFREIGIGIVGNIWVQDFGG